jgi:hypothetical protein
VTVPHLMCKVKPFKSLLLLPIMNTSSESHQSSEPSVSFSSSPSKSSAFSKATLESYRRPSFHDGSSLPRSLYIVMQLDVDVFWRHVAQPKRAGVASSTRCRLDMFACL